ncbi:dihydroxyacetone kinase subunit DhaL [Utexia brackfieldae]|uniref:dihydroxyacetone kinase subunit DhaL n=1 Tax=Utexia brackfieldae TaxID=3074108 RepID=UPI00370D0040
MNVNETQAMLYFTAEKMVESEPTLTALDQVIGDGDHGIGMQRGFAAVRQQLQDPAFQAHDIGDLFNQIGTKLMTTMGGASGAIFGTLFRAGGKSIPGETQLTSQVLATLLNQGWRAVHQRGQAKPGDKTMVDALAAAAQTAQAEATKPLDQALAAVAKAAMAGAEQTQTMIAVFGRAKNLGERALGHIDPGAMSMAYILTFMSDYVRHSARYT